MAWHWVEDKLLSDDEFKEHRRTEGLDAFFDWVWPLLGWGAICVFIGWLFPVWCEANQWFIFPVLLIAFLRAGLFTTIGVWTVVGLFVFTIIEYLIAMS